MSREDLKEVKLSGRLLQLKEQQVQRPRGRNVPGMFKEQQTGQYGWKRMREGKEEGDRFRQKSDLIGP